MYENYDKGIIKEYLRDGVQPAGESILVKFYQSTTQGDPTKGVAKTFVWMVKKEFAVVTSIAQNDVVMSGGIYQLGDIKVQLTLKLTPMDDKAGTVGDRIEWRGHEYRQVGNISTNYLESYILYDYVFRRV